MRTAGRGRSIAIAAAATGLAILVTAGVVLRGRVIESWHIWRLDSTDATARRRAIERLGDLRSARAVPRLLEIFRSDTTFVYIPSPDQPRIYLPLTEDELWTRTVPDLSLDSNLIASALIEIGQPAVPGLLESLRRDDDPWVRSNAMALLAVIGYPVEEAFSAGRRPLVVEGDR